MPHTVEIDITPEQYSDPRSVLAAVARKARLSTEQIARLQPLRRSLDARRGVMYHLTVDVYLKGEPYSEPDYRSEYCDCHNAPPLVIIGAGPAGLFAALRALEAGLRPIILEQGKPVETRKADIAAAARLGIVNPASNWCFGEGGAGTYSDGKLYTRATKRGDVGYVLRKLVEHGADPDILVDTHAHIGTDRLGGIIKNIRQTVLDHGGEYHFGTRVTNFVVSDSQPTTVLGAKDSDGNVYEGVGVVLATGHSSRDIYELFALRGWLLEAKPFAIGVRVEHSQQLIDEIQYHLRGAQGERLRKLLPPASYALKAQVDGHGVFSFCMCPGGVIVPAATADRQQVVNGMSDSHRSSAFANSGIAVTVSAEDVPEYASHGPLALLRFQQEVERSTFEAAGCRINAPSQRLADFCASRPSSSLNKSNYLGSCVSVPVHELLPPFVVKCLQQGFRLFDRKMHGFLTSEASILAVESRTSSPVRIPRDASLQHPQLRNLYPCGEGAGYAGGIVSSAIDGVNAVEAIYSSKL
ncbi:MAG: FAD-binding protein [Bacteroidales bacterium]|nr:FAD-binding protein [Bacteroidales bacterium]